MSRTPGRLSAVLLAVVTALAVALGLLVAPPASAAGTGALSGVVQGKPAGGTAAPLAGARVLLYRSATADGWEPELAGDVTTAANGSWSVTSLDDGYYEIRVLGPDDSLAEEYWDDAWTSYDATLVHLTGSAVTLPRPVVLETPGWVQGRVVDEAGQPVVGASVSFRESEMSGGHAIQTGADGRYDSRNGQYTNDLLPGGYFVSVSTSGDLDDPIYDEAEVQVSVTAGAGTTRDVVLKERPSVVVTVLDKAGAPVAGAPMSVHVRHDPDFMDGRWGPVQYGPNEADDSGRYRITDNFEAFKIGAGLPVGDPGTEAREWWQDTYAVGEATPITFPAGVEKRRAVTIRLGDAPTALTPADPTIGGVARVGRTLTADPGTWGPAGVALSYQWLDYGFDIEGATGRQLTIPASLEGSQLSVRVTGKVAGQPGVDRTSTLTAEVLASDGTTDAAPETAITGSTPQISGTPQAGQRLTAVPGEWAPAGVSLSYAWTAGGTTVGTGPTLDLTNALAGQPVTLTVRGERDGASAVRSSAPTAPVVGVLSAGKVKLAGKAKVGRTLRVRTGTWGPGKVTLRLTWLRDGKKVGGTKPTYRLTRKDRGKRISVRVTGTRQYYGTLVVSSKKSGRVGR